MKILPTIVAEREFSGLLRDEGNYTRKIKELNKLLLEINEKTGIANTVKDAEKMQFQSESIMLEAKAFEQKVHAEDEKFKKAHKFKLDAVRKRESIIRVGEESLRSREARLKADMAALTGRENTLASKIESFDINNKKVIERFDDDKNKLSLVRDRMLAIHIKAQKDLGAI